MLPWRSRYPSSARSRGSCDPAKLRSTCERMNGELLCWRHTQLSLGSLYRRSCSGEQRQEIGSEESSQIEYIPGHFECLRHVRKKYGCLRCEQAGEHPQIDWNPTSLRNLHRYW